MSMQLLLIRVYDEFKKPNTLKRAFRRCIPVSRSGMGDGLLFRPAVPCSAGLYAACLISIFIRAVPVLPLKKGVYSSLQFIAEIFQILYADYVIIDKRNDVRRKFVRVISIWTPGFLLSLLIRFSNCQNFSDGSPSPLSSSMYSSHSLSM